MFLICKPHYEYHWLVGMTNDVCYFICLFKLNGNSAARYYRGCFQKCAKSSTVHNNFTLTALNRCCIMLELDLRLPLFSLLPVQLQQLLNVPLAPVQRRK